MASVARDNYSSVDFVHPNPCPLGSDGPLAASLSCSGMVALTSLHWICDVSSTVRDLIERAKWSDAIVFYDYSNVQCLQTVIDVLWDLHVAVVDIPVTGTLNKGKGVNFTEVFMAVTTSNFPAFTVRHVILCVSPNHVANVVDQALHFGMLSAKYKWLILLPVTHPVEDLASKMTQNSNVLLLQYASVTEGQIPLSNQSLGLYTFTSHPEKQFTQLRQWQTGEVWDVPMVGELFPNIFTDFGGQLLIIGTIPANPFVNRQIVGNQTIYDGFCIELLHTMSTFLNFRYKIVESPDNKYGAPEEDGSWNGMVGMVARKEVDMGVGPYTITSIRETVVDFSAPYMEDGGGILTKKDSSSTRLTAGLETFRGDVWLSLGATVLIVSVSFYFVVRCSPAAMISAEERNSHYWSLWSCVLYIHGSFMMQGMEMHPKNNSARCILGCWWVFAILIISIYTATLASVLTVDLQGSRVDSLEDLARSSVRPLVLSGSLWDTLFQTAEEDVYRKVAERMDDMPEVTSDAVALDYVMSGETAFLHDVNNLRYMYAVNCKQLYLATKIFNSNGFGIILPENAPFKDAVNNLILRLQEGGFLEKWRKRWWPVTTECQPTAGASVSQAKQLGPSKIIGLLVVYATVIAMAMACFLLTLCLSRTGAVRRMEMGCKTICTKKEKAGIELPPEDGIVIQ